MNKIKRNYFPGDEWLYFKIYTGISASENILSKIIFPLTAKLSKQNIISKWFFIRYNDPEFHLRFRMLTTDTKYIGDIILELNRRLTHLYKSKIIYKLDISTYSRELERYGKNSIVQTESFFHTDSIAICKLIKQLLSNPLEYRWMSAIYLIDSFLSTLKFNIDRKIELLTNLDKTYKASFGYNMYNSKQLNELYRFNRAFISKSLDSDYLLKNINNFNQIIKQRNSGLTKILAKTSNINLNVNSCIHMTMNRLCISDARIYELVLYNFLYRYYNSKKAISSQ